jgi:phospholipid/cholesterol/gamma-HCH transport system ATP-binding protein
MSDARTNIEPFGGSPPPVDTPQGRPPAFALGSGPPPDDIVVELRDVHKGFGPKEILKGVSFQVPKGESILVMGGSGTGKSVTIKHVVQLLDPDAGEVWVLGQRADELPGDAMDALRLKIGYLFQSGALFDSMTVYENLDFILDRHTGQTPAERRERIEETLDWVNLTETAPQYPSELSGGQRKRIGLARSIILEPEIMLYDEPTTGLDPISVRVVSDLITRLRDERGISSIAITHDMLCAELIADRIYFLQDGVVGACGTLDEVRQSSIPGIRTFFQANDPSVPVSF